jgi:hypothetical protein
MFAFPSSRRVNSRLCFKRFVQALPDQAGGAAVMTTVDHTLMGGSKPHDRSAAGDGPDKAGQFTGDRGGDDVGRFAGAGELAISGTEPKLRLPGDLADRLGLRLLTKQQLAADPRREAVAPGRLDQQPAGRAVAGLGDRRV